MNKQQAEEALYKCQYQASVKAVNMFFNDEKKADLWMWTKNPLLGNVTPVHMLQLGRFDKLIQFIYDRTSENSR